MTDIGAFALFALIAPDYYWLFSIVLAAIVGNHAVLASLRNYVLITLLALSVMMATGAITGVEQYERTVAVVALVAVGLGDLGVRNRSSMRSARGDKLHALSAARGLAHLTELGGGVVNVVGDTEAVVGWPRKRWLSLDQREIIHPDDLDAFWIDLDDVVDGALYDRTARLSTHDGRWIWLRVVSNDSGGALSHS